jgi:hypothetical protein
VPPVAVQLTAVLPVPVTVAENCCVAPVVNDADVGEIVTDTPDAAVTVTVAVAVTEPPAFVAVKV